MLGCGENRSGSNARIAGEGSAPLTVAPPTPEARPLVVFLGDSLTAGDGVEEDVTFPALVRKMLAERGVVARVVNAGVSGDTSAGGSSRLDWLLAQSPDVVVVALGANDGLRGLDLAALERNLREIVLRIRSRGARAVLAGMRLPPNYGEDYATRFAALYPRLAAELGVALIPFLLEGVGGEVDLNLADGIHPNAEGHARIAATVLPHVEAALARK